jgi:hypothetical protein
VTESDLPDDPKEYKEPWVCYQDEAQGFCFGVVWSNEKLSKIRFGEQSLVTPEYKLGQVKPGDTASTSDLYYVLERGSWQSIRGRWQSLVERKIHADVERVESRPLFNVALADTVLYDRKELKTQLRVVNYRNKGASGKVVLTPPKGWKISPSEVKVEKVTMNNPFTADLTLVPSVQAGLGVHNGSISFLSDKEVARFPLDVCLLSRADKHSVSVTQTKEENKGVFKVSNGLLCFKASAEFSGCLYFLSKNDNINQLCSGFPQIGTKVFLEHYTGGIRGLFLGDSFDFSRSKSHEESFDAEPVEDGLWKGIKFSFESKQEERIKGVLGSTSYLTLPFSNVVKIKRRFENPTSASFKLGLCLWISPNVGGNFKKNDVIFPRGGRIFQFKRTGEPAVAGVPPERGWALIANAEKKTGLGVIAGNPDKSVVLSFDIGKTMLEIMISSRAQLQPKQTCELEDYIILGDADYEAIDKLSSLLRRTI